MSTKAPTERGAKFAQWFRTLLPETVRLAGSWQAQWARCFDDLRRLDGRDEMEIAMVCRWARGEPAARGASVSATSAFWKKNFRTPLKLRERNPEKVMYYDVFAELMWDELGAGAALPGELLALVTVCHCAFCEAAKVTVPVRFYGAQWRTLLESPEYDGDAVKLSGDVRHVVWCIARGISAGKRNVGALKLGTLLEPRRFFEERADARKHGQAFFASATAKAVPSLHAARTVAALPEHAQFTESEEARQKRRAALAELQTKIAGGNGP